MNREFENWILLQLWLWWFFALYRFSHKTFIINFILHRKNSLLLNKNVYFFVKRMKKAWTMTLSDNVLKKRKDREKITINSYKITYSVFCFLFFCPTPLTWQWVLTSSIGPQITDWTAPATIPILWILFKKLILKLLKKKWISIIEYYQKQLIELIRYPEETYCGWLTLGSIDLQPRKQSHWTKTDQKRDPEKLDTKTYPKMAKHY